MSDFLTPDDYKPNVRSEILDAVIRSDQATLEIAEDRAIQQMKSYLGTKYDTDAIFSATGDARLSLVVMFAIDITLYHLYSGVNRMQTPKERVDRYNDAKQWLIMVADGKVVPDGMPTKTDPITGQLDSLNAIIYDSTSCPYRTDW